VDIEAAVYVCALASSQFFLDIFNLHLALPKSLAINDTCARIRNGFILGVCLTGDTNVSRSSG